MKKTTEMFLQYCIIGTSKPIGVSMSNVIFVGDIVEANGKTVKQNNQEQIHGIPLGALVEIVYEDEDDEESFNGLRLFVSGHTRDCDGTPLYDLSHNRNASQNLKDWRQKIDDKEWLQTPDDRYAESVIRWNYHRAGGEVVSGWDESSLKIIRLP